MDKNKFWQVDFSIRPHARPQRKRKASHVRKRKRKARPQLKRKARPQRKARPHVRKLGAPKQRRAGPQDGRPNAKLICNENVHTRST
jgi:hypothetical protein